MITALEAAIEARASALVGGEEGLEVKVFPDDPEAYTLTHPRGAVLVIYRGSAYGNPLSTDVMAQDREMDVDLVILIRNLHSHLGSYAVIETLRGGFAGWMPQGANRGARLVRDEFRAHRNGVWHWGLRLRIPTTSMPTETLDGSLPLLKTTAIEQEFP